MQTISLSVKTKFSNPSSFGKYVKKSLGMSPGQYRTFQMEPTESENPQNRHNKKEIEAL